MEELRKNKDSPFLKKAGSAAPQSAMQLQQLMRTAVITSIELELPPQAEEAGILVKIGKEKVAYYNVLRIFGTNHSFFIQGVDLGPIGKFDVVLL